MRERRIPLWAKVSYTLLVVAVVPSYGVLLGPANFLWLSDVALIGMLAALWLEQRLVASMMAVAVLPLEIAWNVDAFAGLLAGDAPFGIAGYMFDPEERLAIRILSGSFHVALPIVLIGTVARLRYDTRALRYQTPLTWTILIASRWLAGPAANVNFTHGFGLGSGDPWTPLPGALHLALLMLGIPLAVHLPTHLVLRAVFPRRR